MITCIPDYSLPCVKCELLEREARKMSKTATVPMEISKLTKGAVQYKEEDVDDDPMYLIGTLYLRKAGMVHEQLTEKNSREYPAHIKVTIAVVE